MWKALFLAIVISLPVKAEEKVWYCEMTGLAETTIEDAETYKTQKFKMKVSSKEVVFGSGGFFNDISLPIVWWGDENMWQARGVSDNLFFENGAFHFSQSSFNLALAISARCDDF